MHSLLIPIHTLYQEKKRKNNQNENDETKIKIEMIKKNERNLFITFVRDSKSQLLKSQSYLEINANGHFRRLTFN